MLVIMDMEWVDWFHRVSPTQIAALRVRPDWQVDSSFVRLIRPEAGKNQPWDHMAFNGYTTQEILRAPDAPSAFVMLSMWLRPDDVLCWWSAPTAETFITVWKDLLHTGMPCSLRLICPAIEEELYKRKLPPKGSAYGMAKSAGLPLTEQEHCSRDDADVIRRLLRELHTDPNTILNGSVSEIKEGSVVINVGKKKEFNSSLKYVLDMTHRRAHLASCGRIPRGAEKRSMATLEGVIRSLMQPCACLKEEYWTYSRERAEENIRKMQLSFVYAEDSGIFHTVSCIHVKHIPFSMIHGSIRYDTAIARGLRPCGWCRPKPADERKPFNVNREEDDVFRRATVSGSKTKATPEKQEPPASGRTLSRRELNAVKRHQQAVKEREALPDDLKGIQSRDAHVLSQSAYAFWIAEGYQTFHLRNCPKLNGLTHLHGYARFSDVRRYGTPCKLCRPTDKHDIIASVPMNQRVREDETEQQIDELCERYGWKHEAKADAYYIETPVACWKLMNGTHPLEVFHMPKGSGGYHRQHRTFLSMTDTVAYIHRHDESPSVAGPETEKEQERKQGLKLNRMIWRAQRQTG